MANKKGMNPLAAGAVGVAIGTVIGAAAVELSDEKNRNAVGEKLREIKDEGEKVYTQLKETVTEARDKVEGVRNDTEKKIKELAAQKSKT